MTAIYDQNIRDNKSFCCNHQSNRNATFHVKKAETFHVKLRYINENVHVLGVALVLRQKYMQTSNWTGLGSHISIYEKNKTFCCNSTLGSIFT